MQVPTWKPPTRKNQRQKSEKRYKQRRLILAGYNLASQTHFRYGLIQLLYENSILVTN